MILALKKARLPGLALLAAGILLATLVWARIPLTGWIVGRALNSAGAMEPRFNVVRVSPWHVVLEDLGFVVRQQPLAAKRVTIDRRHWWMASLGQVQVEGAQVPLKLDQLPGAKPADGAPPPLLATPDLKVPIEEISVDGQIVLQATKQPEQPLRVKFTARRAAAERWLARADVAGPGVRFQAEASYDQPTGDIEFQAKAIDLEVRPWRTFAENLLSVELASWEVDGRVTGDLHGRWAGGRLQSSGQLRLRDGRIARGPQELTAEGLEADIAVADLSAGSTGTSQLRVGSLKVGKIEARELAAEFVLREATRLEVRSVSLQTLGGTASTEPFTYVFGKTEVDAVLSVDGIDVAQVMALTEELPAKATGRVSGRVPVHFDASGLRLGTGWLGLKPGSNAEIEFNARGLLTGGSSPSSPSYAVLQKIEAGLLRLNVRELRLDIRPPGAAAGRSAQLHIAGEPVDPEVKAPVTLDLNVNGPLESLLNLGLKSRISLGTKP